jgi:hypothetical protein
VERQSAQPRAAVGIEGEDLIGKFIAGLPMKPATKRLSGS